MNNDDEEMKTKVEAKTPFGNVEFDYLDLELARVQAPQRARHRRRQRQPRVRRVPRVVAAPDRALCRPG